MRCIYWVEIWLSHLKTNWYSLRVNQTFYSIQHHISWIYFKNHHLSDLSLTLRAKLFYPNTCNNKICQHMKWELKATSFAKMVLYCIKIECLLPWPWAPADQIGFWSKQKSTQLKHVKNILNQSHVDK